MGFDATPYTSPHISGQWRVELLQRDTWVPTETLTVTSGSTTGVVAGRLDWSIHRQIRDSGDLTLRMPADDARTTRWDRLRVRIGWDMLAPARIQHPLGVYIATTSEVTYTGRYAEVPLVLHGLTTALTRQRLTHTLTLPSGTNTTSAIAQILTESAIRRWVVTPSGHTLGAARTWEPGAPLIDVVNDLLATCGYYAIHTTPTGIVQALPYVPPGDRAVTHVFADDALGLYTPDWKYSRDDWATPNRLTVLQRTGGETPPLSAVVTDDNPASPYRYEERGEWVDADPLEVDATTTEELIAAGRRRLEESQARTQTIAYTYGFVPLAEHDAVRFTSASAGLSADYTISSRSMSLADPVPLVDATIRRVRG